MRLGNVKVEQILRKKVINDYGEILSYSEIKKIIKSFFPNIFEKDGYLYGLYNNKEYCLFCKNISYLGNPHPHYKKRIQISNNFISLYNNNKKRGIETFLLGIYKYKETLLFCDFNTSGYINKKAHNSSAHVYTIDLYNAQKFGYFTKKDYLGNIITTFDESNVINYLNSKLNNSIFSSIQAFDVLDDFFVHMTKEWFGMEAYYEMIKNDYQNKFQPEWPGFYLEYKLSNYIRDNKLEKVISFYQDKRKGAIDLDLFFPQLGVFGDLKAHSLNTDGVQGNDYDTIMDLLEKQSIYYIVVNHETEKDKDHNYIVTEFWNKEQEKDDLRSYSNKMKYSVKIKSYYILELNKYNKKYLKIYHQGINSDGKPRNPKIMISSKDLNNFIIHALYFE